MVKMWNEGMYLRVWHFSLFQCSLNSYPVAALHRMVATTLQQKLPRVWGIFFLFKYVYKASHGWYKPRVEEGFLQLEK